MNDDHALSSPAAIVDDAEDILRAYQYDGHTQSTPRTVADAVAILWTLAGSWACLDINRVPFAYTITMCNLVMGQSVSLTPNYATSTGADT